MRFMGLAAASALAFAAGPCAAVSLWDEATVRGGAYAAQDQDEVAAGYIHVKYSSDVNNARKAYFRLPVLLFSRGELEPFIIILESLRPEATTLKFKGAKTPDHFT